MSLGYQQHTKAMCRAYWRRELKKLKHQTKSMTTPTITPVSIFLTLAPEDKRDGLCAATVRVTVLEVSQG